MTCYGRLLRRADFLRVAANRNKWVAPGVIIQMSAAAEPQPRIGFTASKKVGNAVKRNRARRRLKEAVRQVTRKTHPQGDIVLIARPSTIERDWDALIKDIELSLTELNERVKVKAKSK